MKYIYAALAALVLVACGSNVKNTSQFNPAVSTVGWKTFSWIGDKPMVAYEGDVTRRNPILEQQLQASVQAELESKGYTFVPKGGDFIVAYTVGVREGIDVRETPAYNTSFYGGYGRHYGPYSGYRVGVGYDPFATNTTVDQYKEGVLAVDVYDAKTQAPAWTSRSTKRLSSSAPKHPEEKVREVVMTTFQEFPSRPGLVTAQ